MNKKENCDSLYECVIETICDYICNIKDRELTLYGYSEWSRDRINKEVEKAIKELNKNYLED